MEENKKTQNEEKKSFKMFFNEIKGEFRKIKWASRKELTTKTVTVLATSVIIGIIILSMDAVFGYLYSMAVQLLG